MKSEKPLVSVVMCTYNGERFLARQLDSLLNQSYRHLEIIISDDASTDHTVEIVKEHMKGDNRIKLCTNPVNLGYNRNFEKAFFYASGDFIAVCDQDDIWKCHKIEYMLPLFKNKDTLLVHCQSVRFKEQIPDAEKYTLRRFFEGNDVRKLMYYNTIFGHNIIFRKQLLTYTNAFPENAFYDWWLAINAAVYGKIRGTSYIYTFHRWHTNNATLRKKDNKIQTRSTLEDRSNTLEQILKIPGLKQEDVAFSQRLLKAHSSLEKKKFSLPLFIFLLKHSGIIFYFKKNIWSRVKMAFRLSMCFE